jgi:hypothetical protein
LSAILAAVSFTSEQIAALLKNAGRLWCCAVRLKISAGWGCTVLEIFDRDVPEPSVPIQRIVLASHFSPGVLYFPGKE